MSSSARAGWKAPSLAGLPLSWVDCGDAGQLRGGASLSANEQGELLVGACHDIPVVEFHLDVRAPDDSERVPEGRDLGAHDMAAGDCITFGEHVPGMRLERFGVLAPQSVDEVSAYFLDSQGRSENTAWGVHDPANRSSAWRSDLPARNEGTGAGGERGGCPARIDPDAGRLFFAQLRGPGDWILRLRSLRSLRAG